MKIDTDTNDLARHENQRNKEKQQQNIWFLHVCKIFKLEVLYNVLRKAMILMVIFVTAIMNIVRNIQRIGIESVYESLTRGTLLAVGNDGSHSRNELSYYQLDKILNTGIVMNIKVSDYNHGNFTNETDTQSNKLKGVDTEDTVDSVNGGGNKIQDEPDKVTKSNITGLVDLNSQKEEQKQLSKYLFSNVFLSNQEAKHKPVGNELLLDHIHPEYTENTDIEESKLLCKKIFQANFCSHQATAHKPVCAEHLQEEVHGKQITENGSTCDIVLQNNVCLKLRMNTIHADMVNIDILTQNETEQITPDIEVCNDYANTEQDIFMKEIFLSEETHLKTVVNNNTGNCLENQEKASLPPFKIDSGKHYQYLKITS